ncbi:MAG: hypothetical protein LBJ26_19105 [Paenibacillus sp.]|jgi:hypothetical protein|nr:hypothetical protein [Paenibacillus sp.]
MYFGALFKEIIDYIAYTFVYLFHKPSYESIDRAELDNQRNDLLTVPFACGWVVPPFYQETVSFFVFRWRRTKQRRERSNSEKAVAVAFVPDRSSFKMNSGYSGATAIGGMLRSVASL